MPITLLDELALEQNKLRAGIIQALVEQVMLQDRVPYETTGNMNVSVTYLSDVPTVPLRFINETPAGSQAKFAQLQETLHVLDTDIDIDPVLIANKNQVMPVEVAQVKAVSASIGYRANDLTVNGDPGADARQPLGLKIRLRDDVRFNGQTVNATGSAVELDCRPTATDADLLTWLNKLDELHNLLRNKTSAFLVNQQTILNLWAGLRKLKLLDTTKDQFDREINMYRGVPFLDVGYKETGAINGSPSAAGQLGDQIIGNDSHSFAAAGDPGPGNGANAYTNTSPIYGVVFGEDMYMGLQQEAMRVKPYGETPDPPHFHRTNIRWVFHPGVPFQKRAVGRLIGCAMSVLPA